MDQGDQIIIVEIDENQHKTYDNMCENKRLMEISQDLDHRPIVLIHFNPDNYICNGLSIKSCWTLNKQGICHVQKNKVKEWNNRLETLKLSLEHWINNRTTKMIEEVYLFYDE